MTLAVAEKALPGAAENGILSFSQTSADLIEVRGSGIWSPVYADAHFMRLQFALVQLRHAKGVARVLVDLSEAMVQPADTAARVKYWTGKLYREGDRVAMVVASSLLKIQMRHAVAITAFEVFISDRAARLWLSAYLGFR